MIEEGEAEAELGHATRITVAVDAEDVRFEEVTEVCGSHRLAGNGFDVLFEIIRR